jgi:hypothetical protein
VVLCKQIEQMFTAFFSADLTPMHPHGRTQIATIPTAARAAAVEAEKTAEAAKAALRSF